MRRNLLTATTIACVGALVLAGCGSDGKESAEEPADKEAKVTVMYQRTEGVATLDEMFTSAKAEYEEAHDGVTIELQPIEAAEDDYATQLALSQQTAETAPDIFYQDTFRVRSDVEAGYLFNLDEYLADWDDWSNFNETAKDAGRGDDGSIYAIPLGTDTRAIWYSKPLLNAAGVDVPWEPKSWDDILEMAATVKDHDPEVVPFHLYAGKPAGEGTSMQSFLPLLYGTDARLYDEDSQKWITGSQGFIDSLAFLQTLYDSGYAVPVAEALDGNLWQTFFDWRLPEAKMGGVLEGSYGGSFWQEDGPYEWADYVDDIGVTPFPTQNGQGDGAVSMSGGWTLAMGAQTENPDVAFDFLTTVFNQENVTKHVIDAGKITVRDDVAEDPDYINSGPHVEFFTDIVQVSYYRPATADYPRISSAIQEATENVVTNKMSPTEAAASYDKALEQIVGADNTMAAQ